MFQKVGPSSVRSDDGYLVRRISRSCLIYEENGLTLKIEVEIGVNDLAVYLSAATEWNIGEDDIRYLTQDEREKVMNRIQAALKFLHVPHVIL